MRMTLECPIGRIRQASASRFRRSAPYWSVVACNLAPRRRRANGQVARLAAGGRLPHAELSGSRRAAGILGATPVDDVPGPRPLVPALGVYGDEDASVPQGLLVDLCLALGDAVLHQSSCNASDSAVRRCPAQSGEHWP